MFIKKFFFYWLTTSLTFASLVHGLVARQGDNRLTSGAYVLFSLSVSAHRIGSIEGGLVGVMETNDSDPAAYRFDLVEYEQGYAIHFAAGNAAQSGNVVTLVQDYPATLWRIDYVPSSGVYTIETTDRAYGWVLPHGAPAGTPVYLTSSPEPPIVAQYFVFEEAE